jgi:hypothetical protein
MSVARGMVPLDLLSSRNATRHRTAGGSASRRIGESSLSVRWDRIESLCRPERERCLSRAMWRALDPSLGVGAR